MIISVIGHITAIHIEIGLVHHAENSPIFVNRDGKRMEQAVIKLLVYMLNTMGIKQEISNKQ